MTVRRRIGTALTLALTASVSVAGCDGGPAFSSAAEIDNQCELPIRVTIAEDFRQVVEVPTPGSAHEIGVDTKYVLNNAILKPIPEMVYVYVATGEDAEFRDPTALEVASLDKRVAEDGTDVYQLAVSGDMCPRD